MPQGGPWLFCGCCSINRVQEDTGWPNGGKGHTYGPTRLFIWSWQFKQSCLPEQSLSHKRLHVWLDQNPYWEALGRSYSLSCLSCGLSRMGATLCPASFPLNKTKKPFKPGLDLTPSTFIYKLCYKTAETIWFFVLFLFLEGGGWFNISISSH